MDATRRGFLSSVLGGLAATALPATTVVATVAAAEPPQNDQLQPFNRDAVSALTLKLVTDLTPQGTKVVASDGRLVPVNKVLIDSTYRTADGVCRAVVGLQVVAGMRVISPDFLPIRVSIDQNEHGWYPLVIDAKDGTHLPFFIQRIEHSPSSQLSEFFAAATLPVEYVERSEPVKLIVCRHCQNRELHVVLEPQPGKIGWRYDSRFSDCPQCHRVAGEPHDLQELRYDEVSRALIELEATYVGIAKRPTASRPYWDVVEEMTAGAHDEWTSARWITGQTAPHQLCAVRTWPGPSFERDVAPRFARHVARV
jgi:hypothetical protein